MSIDANEIDAVRKTIFESQGDVIIMVGAELSSDAQATIAANAASLNGDGRRVLLHPLAPYNNSIGAIDMLPGAKNVDEVVKNSRALLVAGSLQDATVLQDKEFVVVQELFETETTEHADVVLPAASFAEVDGTFTNNAGQVQRVRKSIEPVHRAKPDWMIALLIARSMGAEVDSEFSASTVFRSIAESIPAYEGLRYPMLKDESNPVQAKHLTGNHDVSANVEALRKSVEAMQPGEKHYQMPQVGHKLHRLTTLTSKTPQFHLLANGNPKPENLLVSPLEQFELDGTARENDKAEAAAIGLGDRSNVGGR
jgi:NADH dehydrogenase/NADH:ubiquinone oxidoreductase subunit G